MTSTNIYRLFGRVFRLGDSRLRAFAAAALIAAVFIVHQTREPAAGAAVPALPYSLSFTIAGNYATASVALQPALHTAGFQTGVMHMGTSATRVVPEGATIVAAYLYWETIWSSPAKLWAPDSGTVI